MSKYRLAFIANDNPEDCFISGNEYSTRDEAIADIERIGNILVTNVTVDGEIYEEFHIALGDLYLITPAIIGDVL
jgi:hypothetical protein